MVPILNMKARQGMSLHWDGLSASLARSGAQQRAWRRREPQSRSSLPNLERIEKWLLEVQPPTYPYPMSIKALAGGGTRRSTKSSARSATRPAGARTGTVVPVEEVGTDRHRLDMWTPAAPVAYNKFAEGYPWAFTGFKKTNGYVSVPLDGVWLRAPYLHNGSVPTLQELFDPVESRRATFYRGYNVFDPVARRLRLRRRRRRPHGMPLRYASARQQQRRAHLYGTELTPGTEEGAHRVLEDSLATDYTDSTDKTAPTGTSGHRAERGGLG